MSRVKCQKARVCNTENDLNLKKGRPDSLSVVIGMKKHCQKGHDRHLKYFSNTVG